MKELSREFFQRQGRIGGKRRAASLTAAERSEIARKGALAANLKKKAKRAAKTKS